MALVGIKGRKKRRTLLNDAYAGVRVSVNAPFVSFGEAEPAFQVQVVARKIARALHEQAGREALHDAGHVVVERRRGRSKSDDDLIEHGPAFARRAGVRVERAPDEPELCNALRDLFKFRLHRRDPPIDARGELRQLAITRPPFSCSVQRLSEARTSPSASAIRTPGGCSGPP